MDSDIVAPLVISAFIGGGVFSAWGAHRVGMRRRVVGWALSFPWLFPFAVLMGWRLLTYPTTACGCSPGAKEPINSEPWLQRQDIHELVANAIYAMHLPLLALGLALGVAGYARRRRDAERALRWAAVAAGVTAAMPVAGIAALIAQ